MSANLFYVDLYNGKLCRSGSGEELTFPDLVAGGSVSFSIRFLEYVGGYVEADQDITALRVSVGAMDARPLSGRYKIGAGSPANTTDFLDWNAPAWAVQSALNALGGQVFSCDDVPGGILIRSNQEAVLTVVSNRLVPRSFGRITGRAVDGAWLYELRLTQAPLSFSDTAVRILPDSPSISTVQDGGADPSGTTVWNEIQALHVPPKFRGTYQLRYGYGKTKLLDPSDGTSQLQEALNEILDDIVFTTLSGSQEKGGCVVTNPTTNIAHIEFTGALGGLDLDPLEVRVFSAPPGDWTFELPLDRSEMLEALRESETITVPFEGEADFYLDPLDHGAGTVTRKLWSTTVRIKRPLIFPDMEEVPGVDWLWQNPKDYVPFSASQVITGQQHFTQVIGTGAATTIAIAHGLGTDNLAGVMIRENLAGGRILEPDEYSVRITSANSIEITFPVAPALNSLAVVVTSAGPASAFSAHRHTISEIGDEVEGVFVTTLRNVLDDFGQRIERLEGLIGRADVVVVASGNKKSEFVMPAVGEVLPDISNEDSVATVASQVVVGETTQSPIGGTELEEQKAAAQAELTRIQAELEAIKKAKDDAAKSAAEEAAKAVVIEKATQIVTRISFPAVQSEAAKPAVPAVPASGNTPETPGTAAVPAKPLAWPVTRGTKMPWLLPAIHDVAATNAAVLPSGSVGSLYHASASFVLPGGGGRKPQHVGIGDYFAFDGRCFYRVVRQGVSNSWHPLEMERELMRAVLRPDQFPSASELTLGWNIEAMLLADQFDAEARDISRTLAQYLLLVEAVAIPDTTTPGTPGLNVGAEGSVVTLCSARIDLSPASESHTFSMKLKRSPEGVGSGTVTRYGVAAETPPLPPGPFVLRVRLSGFDVDDTSTDPRGQVVMLVPASQLTVTLTR
ncbi:MAG: hypothetical protein D4R65_12745 [Verrucomicrobiaceae bacterium]|nr:MAG: hypothetical protein D4R65_12745 [Verrucomicrobiaceae bacterium]